MKRKSWMLGVLFVLVILVSYMAKPEKVQSDCPLGGKTKFVMIGYSLE